MSRLILLVGNDDSTMLIECPDLGTAEKVGRAAIYAEGGVSAYLIPTAPYTDMPSIGDLIQLLRSGATIPEIVTRFYPYPSSTTPGGGESP